MYTHWLGSDCGVRYYYNKLMDVPIYNRGERLDRPRLASISNLEYNVKTGLERMKQALLEQACGFPPSDVTSGDRRV